MARDDRAHAIVSREERSGYGRGREVGVWGTRACGRVKLHLSEDDGGTLARARAVVVGTGLVISVEEAWAMEVDFG
jgi:hypothetical protein